MKHWDSISVATLGIPTRVLSSLAGASIQTIGQILQRNEMEMRRVPGMGRRSITELAAALSDIGIIWPVHDRPQLDRIEAKLDRLLELTDGPTMSDWAAARREER